MIYAVLFALLVSVSATLAQAPVDPTQLAGWQNFFTSTGGSAWSKCSGKRNTPCTCSGTVNAVVTCEEVNGVSFITSIKLRNNNLVGPNVPGSQLESILSARPGFTSLDIGNNKNLKNSRGGCINIPSCNTGVTCLVDYPVCASGGTAAPTPASGETSSPTSPPVASAQAWRTFFDATSGSNWAKCKNTRTTPCDCQRNQPATATVKVVCAGTVINRISMIDNNLVATDFPARAVGDLILAGATYVDLSSNPSLGGDVPCFDVPECAASGVTCIFAKPLCQASLSPGVSPTVTPSVTDSPATESPGTNTTSPSPTTTVSPSTNTPATKSPTAASVPPSTNGTTTASPTNNNGTTTASPTPGGTNTTAPTPSGTNTTRSPSGQATKSPTIGIQTPSPTESVASFSVVARSVFVALALGFAAILA